MSSLAWHETPSNVTDAGPETRSTEPPPDFDDLCAFARDECKAAQRLYRDDKTAQHKLRREALQRAQDHIVAALWILGAEV